MDRFSVKFLHHTALLPQNFVFQKERTRNLDNGFSVRVPSVLQVTYVQRFEVALEPKVSSGLQPVSRNCARVFWVTPKVTNSLVGNASSS